MAPDRLLPILQGLATFPAIEGKGFTDVRYLQGPAKLLETFRQPPATIREILFPPAGPAPGPAPEPPPCPGTKVLEDTAGALGVRLLIDTLKEPALARRFAAAWTGDRWRLAADHHGEHLGWAVRLAEPGSAAAFATAARELAAIRAGRDQAPPGDAPLATPAGGIIRINRPQPELVHFTHLAAGSPR